MDLLATQRAAAVAGKDGIRTLLAEAQVAAGAQHDPPVRIHAQDALPDAPSSRSSCWVAEGCCSDASRCGLCLCRHQLQLCQPPLVGGHLGLGTLQLLLGHACLVGLTLEGTLHL